jgi:Tfp pilus assembly protein PilZ
MPVSFQNHRREEPRFAVRLPLKILSSRDHDELFTWDVSFRGLFVETAHPLSLRQLVRFAITTPTTGRELVLHGMVAAVVGPNDPEGRPEGMGLSIYALEGETRGAWWGLVRFVRDQLHELEQPSRIRVRQE